MSFSPWQVSSVNQQSLTMTQDFSAYCDSAAQLIAQARQLDPTDPVVTANSPFEWHPEQAPKAAIVLIHGLMTSPYYSRALAHHFLQQGLLVRALLLPGHGTLPGDLLTVRAEAWREAVHHTVKPLVERGLDVFILGYSTGGTLALDYAYRETDLAGVLLFAPALKIREPLTFLGGMIDTIGYAIPRLRWLSQTQQRTPVKYDDLAVNGGYQVYCLIQQLKPQLRHEPPCKVLLSISTEDEVVCPETALTYLAACRAPDHRAIIFSNQANPYRDKRIVYHPSRAEAQRVVDFSHVGLSMPSDDPYFGYQGQYPERIQHQADAPHYYAANNRYNRAQYPHLSRLTFNPHLDHLLAHCDEFIAKR